MTKPITLSADEVRRAGDVGAAERRTTRLIGRLRRSLFDFVMAYECTPRAHPTRKQYWKAIRALKATR